MPDKKILRIGSRGSRLAVTQAEWVAKELQRVNPSLAVEFVRITTTGDRNASQSLTAIGGKGVFVKEIEDALLRKEIDLAVHSLKDVPQTIPTGLRIGPCPQREDPREAVVSRFGELLEELPKGSIVGTSSPRRVAQIKRRFSKRGYRIEPLRGNVDTRLAKVRDGVVDAAVMALAGLKRIGLEKEVTQILEMDEMMPPPCQGCLGLELREDDTATLALIESIQHEESDRLARAERAFLLALGGNCLAPVAATGRRDKDDFSMEAVLWDLSGEKEIRVQERGLWSEPDLVGAKLAGRLLYEGGAELMLAVEEDTAKLHAPK